MCSVEVFLFFVFCFFPVYVFVVALCGHVPGLPGLSGNTTAGERYCSSFLSSF